MFGRHPETPPPPADPEGTIRIGGVRVSVKAEADHIAVTLHDKRILHYKLFTVIDAHLHEKGFRLISGSIRQTGMERQGISLISQASLSCIAHRKIRCHSQQNPLKLVARSCQNAFPIQANSRKHLEMSNIAGETKQLLKDFEQMADKEGLEYEILG
ncbi:MAG: hypothetical protein ACK502_02820 [Alphaproteobacteria bacterium]